MKNKNTNEKQHIRNKTQQQENSFVVITSSVCELEVSYEVVNGKHTKQIIETGTTYQEKNINAKN